MRVSSSYKAKSGQGVKMSSLYVNQMSTKLNRKSVRSKSTRIDNVRLICAQAVGFRPCIDIHKGKVKQIVGSTLSDLKQDKGASGLDLETNFESTKPAEYYAELYKKDNLPGGHVIMLGADEESKKQAYGALQAYPGGLQLGGGVNTDNAIEYLDAGASHVIVTSFVFRDGKLDEERLDELVKKIGKERIVLDLSCRRKDDGKYYVVTDRWQKWSDLALSQESLEMLSQKCEEFLVHGVDVEGKKLGIDDGLVEILGAWSPVPVTYAGGASTMEDLERVARIGNSRVEITVGSALDIFGGSLKYADVVAWHRAQQSPSIHQGQVQPDGTIMYRF